ncbi:hypothetical protein [Kitasatospora sp. McL0602]|uniref:hypothetical protein n=1 Tax=Kitasatospora sp. McL0602 TaxID=3439530 RepID=UPI003F89CB6F
MIVIIGLVILIAAVVVAVAGVVTNTGSAHSLVNDFSVFGYHVTGSSGALFLYGIVVGALAVLGLGMLLNGARRASRVGHEARSGLRESRRQAAAVRQERDALAEKHEDAQAKVADAQAQAAQARVEAADARAEAAKAQAAAGRAAPASANRQNDTAGVEPEAVPPDAEFGSHRHGFHRWGRVPAHHAPGDQGQDR